MFSSVFNVFKKKQQPQAQVQSVKTPTYQSIMANSSQKSSQPKTSYVSLASKPKTLGYGGPQQTNYSSAGSSSQTTQQPSLRMASPPKPQMSVAPKTIQGSGYGSQYASNPSNYKPPVQQGPQQQAPTPKRSPLDSFIERAGQIGNEKMKFINDQRAGAEKYIKDSYALQNQALESAVPQAQDAFNRFRGMTEADVADMKARGEIEKGEVTDHYGAAQREGAQTLRETRGQTQRTFANLGTLDSYGEGSFKQSTENTDSNFNRFTQENLKARANKLTEIDMQVGQAERKATELIAQEGAKLKQLEDQITLALSQNRIDEAEALRSEYAKSQDLIFQVQDNLEQLKYAQQVEQMNFDLEMSEYQNLSPEFLTTGVPTTEADYLFRLKNPDNVNKAFNPNGGQKPTEKSQMFGLAASSAQQALDLLNSGQANTGKGQAISSAFGRTFDQSTPGQTDYESKLAAARGVALNALSGANVPESEYARIAAMIPVATDEPNNAKQKLQSFVEIMNMYGQGMANTQPDLLNENQLSSILTQLQSIQ